MAFRKSESNQKNDENKRNWELVLDILATMCIVWLYIKIVISNTDQQHVNNSKGKCFS